MYHTLNDSNCIYGWRYNDTASNILEGSDTLLGKRLVFRLMAGFSQAFYLPTHILLSVMRVFVPPWMRPLSGRNADVRPKYGHNSFVSYRRVFMKKWQKKTLKTLRDKMSGLNRWQVFTVNFHSKPFII